MGDLEMPKAVLKNGVIYPIEPLPLEWGEGRDLRVEDAQQPNDSPEALDEWSRQLEALAALIDPKDVERLEQALVEADRQAKEQVLREAGLM